MKKMKEEFFERCRHRVRLQPMGRDFCQKHQLVVNGWNNAMCKNCRRKKEVMTDTCDTCPMCQDDEFEGESFFYCTVHKHKILAPKAETCRSHPANCYTEGHS